MGNIFKEKWNKITKGPDEEFYCDACKKWLKISQLKNGTCPVCGELLTKSMEVQKPGMSIHSQKWDDCVNGITDPSVNAYAVCTAQLGEESFKSAMTYQEVLMAKAELEKAIDIMEAGNIPSSLLARQDLEPTSEKGAIEQTGKALNESLQEAKGVEDETEKDGLIRNIKNIQLKRQQATINARKGIFKNIWKKEYGQKN